MSNAPDPENAAPPETSPAPHAPATPAASQQYPVEQQPGVPTGGQPQYGSFQQPPHGQQPPYVQQQPYGQQPPYPQPYPSPYAPPRPTNALSIVALVLSLIGISIAAVICGHISLRQIKRTSEAGYGMAVAGLVIGYVGCAGWILFWIIWAIAFIIPLIMFGSIAITDLPTSGYSTP